MGAVPSAANDPIFPLHHSFVDRIYEKWLRKFRKDSSVLSKFDAPIGHNKDDVIVPMFPLYTHQEMFRKSLDFGYEYEDVDEKGKYDWTKIDRIIVKRIFHAALSGGHGFIRENSDDQVRLEFLVCDYDVVCVFPPRASVTYFRHERLWS